LSLIERDNKQHLPWHYLYFAIRSLSTQQSGGLKVVKMKKLMLIALLMGQCVTSQAQPIKFLEEKTAFCYSEKALTKYLAFAKKRNLEGMNRLVLQSKCDFVPDGEVVQVTDFRIDSIGSMKVVEFKIDNLTVWTFKALVQTTDFSNL
jgi:hypothetical protein